MKKGDDSNEIFYELFLLSPQAVPILMAVGTFILAKYFPAPVVVNTIVALIIGALGLSVPRAWLEFQTDQRKSPIEKTASAPKRILFRLGMYLLAGLCLLISLFFIYHGLQVRNLLLIPIGFISALLCSLFLVTAILGRMGLRVNEMVQAAVSLFITVGISTFIILTSQVEIDPACYGQGVVASATYSEGQVPHPVEIVHYGRRIWYWRWFLPGSWLPASVEETELVACVGPVEEYVIETCQYYGSSVTRYGYKRQVVLRTAKTGEIVASETFRGESPSRCKQTEESSTTKLKGSRWINPNELREWLREYVEENRSGTDVVELPLEVPLAVSPEPMRPEAETVPEVFPEPLQQEPVPEVLIEPLQPETVPEESPSAIVTPGSQPPLTGVLTGNPSLWSSPVPAGAPVNPENNLGIILKQGELVEILATTDEWAKVLWVSPEQNEVTGWVEKRWLDIQAADASP
jgi:hypothetical protein